MLKQVAADVFVHESEFIQSNTTVIQGSTGVLLVDPGITRADLHDLAQDLRAMGQPVVAGFSTHPDWDHVLWDASLGDVPRYGTARNAAAMKDVLALPDWNTQVAEALPPEHANEIPIELFGQITGLPSGATSIPWDGPTVRVLEHRGHSVGHAALLIENSRVLVAGDTLSDILMPFLDLDATNPIDDYLAALALFHTVVDKVNVVVPGHGSVAEFDAVRSRISRDRAYLEDVRDHGRTDDYRVGASAPLYWIPGVHDWQLQRLTQNTTRASHPEWP